MYWYSVSKIPTIGPSGLDTNNRNAWQTCVWNVLQSKYGPSQYRIFDNEKSRNTYPDHTDAAAKKTAKIPGAHPSGMVIQDHIILVGYPLSRSFGDPSICAVHAGICYFRELEDGERAVLIAAWEQGVKEKIYKLLPKRKERSDAGVYLGRRADPETARKMRGGWVRSEPMVPERWDEEN